MFSLAFILKIQQQYGYTEIMRKEIIFAVIFIFTFQIHMPAKVDKFRTGKVKIEKILEITDESLPDDILLENPRSLALHPNGNLFVCDFKANDIKIFDENGEYLLTIGRPGQGPGDLQWPSKIALLNDRIAVWEVANRRISMFFLNGEFIKSIKFNDDTGIPLEIKSLADEYFLIGKIRDNYEDEKFPQEYRLDLYSDEMNFIKTIYTKKIFMFKRLFQPRRADIIQPYNPRVFWDVSPSGGVVIGYSEEYRIDVLDPERGVLFSFSHDYKPIEISEDDKKHHFARMNIAYIENKSFVSRQKGAPDFIIDNTNFPKKKPAFNSIVCDSAGNIWVHSYLTDRKIEDLFFDVFDPNGKYINRIEIEGDTKFPYLNPKSQIKNNVFWQIITDDNDNRIVTKFVVDGE